MAKKIKIHSEDFTPAEIGFLVGELAEQEIQSAQIIADMNAELDSVRARYESKLQILRSNINLRREALEQWAEAHAELFISPNPRSMEFERGTIGFRTGMPKLKLLPRRTWESVKEYLEKSKQLEYTRAEISVARDLLIADADTLGEEKLKAIGVKVVQDDAFFCDIKADRAVKQDVAKNEDVRNKN